MLVNAPVLQEFINGAKTAIVAAGAYARVGEIPLWLVIVAGFAAGPAAGLPPSTVVAAVVAAV